MLGHVKATQMCTNAFAGAQSVKPEKNLLIPAIFSQVLQQTLVSNSSQEFVFNLCTHMQVCSIITLQILFTVGYRLELHIHNTLRVTELPSKHWLME